MDKYKIPVPFVDLNQETSDIIDLESYAKIPEEVATDWDHKVRLELNKHVQPIDSDAFFKCMDWYKRELKEVSGDFADNETLKKCMMRHLKFFELTIRKSYHLDVNKYLDIMEDLLTFYANLIISDLMEKKNTINKREMKKMSAYESRRLKSLLLRCLLEKQDSVAHVLMRIDSYPHVQPCRDVLNNLFGHFLTKLHHSPTNLNYIRFYIICQKWKQTRKPNDWQVMEKFVNDIFKRNPDSINKNHLFKNILLEVQPRIAETLEMSNYLYDEVKMMSREYFKIVKSPQEVEFMEIEDNDSNEERFPVWRENDLDEDEGYLRWIRDLEIAVKNFANETSPDIKSDPDDCVMIVPLPTTSARVPLPINHQPLRSNLMDGAVIDISNEPTVESSGPHSTVIRDIFEIKKPPDAPRNINLAQPPLNIMPCRLPPLNSPSPSSVDTITANETVETGQHATVEIAPQATVEIMQHVPVKIEQHVTVESNDNQASFVQEPMIDDLPATVDTQPIANAIEKVPETTDKTSDIPPATIENFKSTVKINENSSKLPTDINLSDIAQQLSVVENTERTSHESTEPTFNSQPLSNITTVEAHMVECENLQHLPVLEPAETSDTQLEIVDEVAETVDEVLETLDELPETVDGVLDTIGKVSETVDKVPETVDKVQETVDEVPEAVNEVLIDIQETIVVEGAINSTAALVERRVEDMVEEIVVKAPVAEEIVVKAPVAERIFVNQALIEKIVTNPPTAEKIVANLKPVEKIIIEPPRVEKKNYKYNDSFERFLNGALNGTKTVDKTIPKAVETLRVKEPRKSTAEKQRLSWLMEQQVSSTSTVVEHEKTVDGRSEPSGNQPQPGAVDEGRHEESDSDNFNDSIDIDDEFVEEPHGEIFDKAVDVRKQENSVYMTPPPSERLAEHVIMTENKTNPTEEIKHQSSSSKNKKIVNAKQAVDHLDTESFERELDGLLMGPVTRSHTKFVNPDNNFDLFGSKEEIEQRNNDTDEIESPSYEPISDFQLETRQRIAPLIVTIPKNGRKAMIKQANHKTKTKRGRRKENKKKTGQSTLTPDPIEAEPPKRSKGRPKADSIDDGPEKSLKSILKRSGRSDKKHSSLKFCEDPEVYIVAKDPPPSAFNSRRPQRLMIVCDYTGLKPAGQNAPPPTDKGYKWSNISSQRIYQTTNGKRKNLENPTEELAPKKRVSRPPAEELPVNKLVAAATTTAHRTVKNKTKKD